MCPNNVCNEVCKLNKYPLFGVFQVSEWRENLDGYKIAVQFQFRSVGKLWKLSNSGSSSQYQDAPETETTATCCKDECYCKLILLYAWYLTSHPSPELFFTVYRSPLSIDGRSVTKTKKGQELPSAQLLPKIVETTEVSGKKNMYIYMGRGILVLFHLKYVASLAMCPKECM